jgi:hypothetical protein
MEEKYKTLFLETKTEETKTIKASFFLANLKMGHIFFGFQIIVQKHGKTTM